ncbi:hypothetical protein OJAV_G00107410 [Oryzias javanicus]|uniref:Transmembrane protein 54b n=1 Tax=Oryzias javanicus TaxID=123683 RepID=A0A3S2M2C5_ORYJA|nr:hypothetical protein OJAV_G00107410 [Oryzias javanicus]
MTFLKRTSDLRFLKNNIQGPEQGRGHLCLRTDRLRCSVEGVADAAPPEQTHGDLTEMAGSGLCCGSLEEPKALMKMGLSAIIVGHVNFLLGALVHGVVLRHINQHRQARAMLYSISNVVALTSGMVGVIVGILAIVLSKNKKSRSLTWSLFSFGLVSAIMSVASTVGLFISVVRAIVNNGRSLLTHCRFPDAIGYSSVTNECPFDPTRIYSTTLILWVPLIVMCIVQLVFSARCSAACASFLGLPCCPRRKKSPPHIRARNVGKPFQEVYHSHCTDNLGSHSELQQPSTDHRHHKKTARANTEPSRTHVEPKKPYGDHPRTSHKPEITMHLKDTPPPLLASTDPLHSPSHVSIIVSLSQRGSNRSIGSDQRGGPAAVPGDRRRTSSCRGPLQNGPASGFSWI